MPSITPAFVSENEKDWKAYNRDEDKLNRKWAIPGMKGFEHRIGGLEKQEVTGNVSYDPSNHETMVKLRAEKVARVAEYIPEVEVEGSKNAELLVVGWGGTYGGLHTAIAAMQTEGLSVAHAHFNYINPLPKNTAQLFAKYKKIVVCELNNGQFVKLLRSELPQFDYLQYNKIQGLPFSKGELVAEFKKLIEA